jgi:cellulose synthase/poly-beta-1,6-N-acetylglucosamine synthase-like glycosyltransferase
MAAVFFWASLGIVLYVYVGYPALLALWARVRRRTHLRSDTLRPSVSVVVAARNEAERLPARIENLLASDYPGDRLEIVIVSDGSVDGTARAVAPYVRERPAGNARAPRVRLIERPAEGKAAALNHGVAAASHEVIVFADARQRFAPDTIRRLAANFADPAVGVASGELVLDCETGPSESSVGDGVGAYWRYEKWLRSRESEIDSMLGATGAVYAMRKSCWRDLPAGTILDDVLAPMRAVMGGYRAVFDPRARAFDTVAADAAVESRRKSRTLAGNYQILALEPRLLVPGLNRVFVQYLSHKIGRLLVPWALAALLVSNVALVASSPIYVAAALGQALFYGLAIYGALLERRSRPAAAGPVRQRLSREGKVLNA